MFGCSQDSDGPKKVFVTLHPSPPPKTVSLMFVRRFLGSHTTGTGTPEIGGLATAKG